MGQTQRERVVQDAAAAWLEGTGYRVEDLVVDEADVYVRIAGHGDVPRLEELSDALLGQDVDVASLSLSVLDEQRIVN